MSVGPLFGELLAWQFAEWFSQTNDPGPCQIIEAGAHDGALAADILGWLGRCRPALWPRVEYCLLEPSAQRRSWQQETLAPWRGRITWARDFAELAPTPGWRIIFCNELLDAMPVHRLAWDRAAGSWSESCVAWVDNCFAWQKAPVPPALAALLPAVAAELAEVLPEGFSTEISPAAIAWWQQAAAALQRGILLTFDYGLAGLERFHPRRTGGTLRAFSRHLPSASVFDNAGEQDITASVDFVAIEAAGRRAGLAAGSAIEQGQFLTQILARLQARPDSFEEWTPARARQFQTLTHPEHLGRAFRALAQSR